MAHRLKSWAIRMGRSTIYYSFLTGAYAFAVPFFMVDGVLIELPKFYGILGGVGLILLTFEYLRGKGWSNWLNSRLDKLISSYLSAESDVKRMVQKNRHLLFSLFLTLGLFAGDIFGAWSLKNIINQKFISWHMAENEEYQGELVKLKNATKTYLNDKEFKLELTRLKQETAQRRQCNKQYPLPKWKTANKNCFENWLKEHKQSKFSSVELETAGLVADSFPNAYAEAEAFAKPYQWFMFGLFLFVAIMAHYLANRDSSEAYQEQREAIEQFPELYVTDLEHYRECERTEKSEISSINRETNEKMLKLNIETKRKVEGVKVDGYKEVKKIELQSVQNNTEDFKRLVNENFSRAEQKRQKRVGANNPSDDNSNIVIEGQVVASQTTPQPTAENPIGFRAGDETTDHRPMQPKAPITQSGYFDDGYDLTLAILCLFDFGRKEIGEELLSNKELFNTYNAHPLKRNDLVLNQISSLVRKPLKDKRLVAVKNGHKDRALFSMAEVIQKLGLFYEWSEIQELKKKETIK